jgi:hypothetical protein
MNPLEWKREHQIALVISILIGLMLGLAFGYARDPHIGSFVDWFTTALDPNYPGYTGTGWSIFGALVAGGIVYATVLLRK